MRIRPPLKKPYVAPKFFPFGRMKPAFPLDVALFPNPNCVPIIVRLLLVVAHKGNAPAGGVSMPSPRKTYWPLNACVRSIPHSPEDSPPPAQPSWLLVIVTG